MVDDEEAMVTLLTGWIETLGFSIASAPNGALGLQVAREFAPDVILMDAMMPVMGGFEALLALKRDPALCHIPVLFLTVRDEIQDVVSALDQGATDYLTKPFKPQQLLARLRSIVRMKQQQDRLRQQASLDRQNLESWLQNLPAGYLALDGEGRATAWNQLAQQATGLAEDQVLGRPAEEFVLCEEPRPWAQRKPYVGPATLLGQAGPLPVRVLGRPLPEGGYTLLLCFALNAACAQDGAAGGPGEASQNPAG